MRAQAARKLYPGVDGAERFRLIAFALSRGDLAEAEHLLETAPRVRVVARDLDLLEAQRRFTALHARFDRQATALLGWLVLLDVIEPFARNLIGEAETFEARIYADLLRAYLDGARRQALSGIKGLLQILDERGTEQLGMDAATILAVPMSGCAGLLQRYHDEVKGAGELEPKDLASLRAEFDWPHTKKDSLDAVC